MIPGGQRTLTHGNDALTHPGRRNRNGCLCPGYRPGGGTGRGRPRPTEGFRDNLAYNRAPTLRSPGREVGQDRLAQETARSGSPALLRLLLSLPLHHQVPARAGFWSIPEKEVLPAPGRPDTSGRPGFRSPGGRRGAAGHLRWPASRPAPNKVGWSPLPGLLSCSQQIIYLTMDGR
jgi:hypothetical protein